MRHPAGTTSKALALAAERGLVHAAHAAAVRGRGLFCNPALARGVQMWATCGRSHLDLVERLNAKAPGQAALKMAAPEECKSCYRRS